MVDTVTSDVLLRENRRVVYHLTNVSDGSGEADVIKANKSDLDLLGQDPAVSTGHMAIMRVHGFIYGMTYVKLHWDHTTDDTALLLGPGNFDLDFSSYGGARDPQSAGDTGDLLLTTVGASLNDVYDITLDIRLYK